MGVTLGRLFGRTYLLGAGAFGTASNFVLHYLTFSQVVEANPDDFRVVEENIVAVTLQNHDHQPTA